MYSAERMTGLAVGICVGLVIVILVMRLLNKDHRFKTDYDERQERIRGRGYMYGFYATLITLALLCVISTGMAIPAEPFIIYFLPIFIGAVVQVCYCIWNGAYIGQNTNIRRFAIFMILISAFNIWVGINAWRHGSLFVDGILQAPFVNFLCGALFAIVALTAALRKVTDREVE